MTPSHVDQLRSQILCANLMLEDPAHQQLGHAPGGEKEDCSTENRGGGDELSPERHVRQAIGVRREAGDHDYSSQKIQWISLGWYNFAHHSPLPLRRYSDAAATN